MSTLFAVPSWVSPHDFTYASYDDVPLEVLDGLRDRLARFRPGSPEVSIVICAWNEEVNILKTLSSLADSTTTLPVEIVVVNNNSTDRTQEALDHLGVINCFQPIQGWGPARQMGQERASGKYVLLADADCLYPPGWVDSMYAVLSRPGVVCVYGRYAFLPAPGFPRWKLATQEGLRNVIAEVRHLKRPFLNAYGMSMGYLREYGLKVGFVMHKIRGEDGRLCFDLMQYGSVRQVKAAAARVWTRPRTLQAEGSFTKALLRRVLKEIKRFGTLLTPMPAHDTKVSTND